MVLMNTLSSRFQAWSGLVLSTLILLTAVIAFLTHPSPTSLSSHNTAANLNITSLQPVYGRSTWHLDKSLQEYLEVEWSLQTDLTNRLLPNGKKNSLWTWNTKQLYLSLVVQWDSPITSTSTGKGTVKNEAVLWDSIVRRREDASLLNVFAEGNKYGVRELTRKWAHIPSAQFTLKWNLMPKVGLLAYGNEVTSGQIPIPQRLISEQEAQEGKTHRGKRMPY